MSHALRRSGEHHPAGRHHPQPTLQRDPAVRRLAAVVQHVGLRYAYKYYAGDSQRLGDATKQRPMFVPVTVSSHNPRAPAMGTTTLPGE